MGFEIKKVLTANEISLVNDKGKEEQVNISELNRDSRNFLKEVVFYFFDCSGGKKNNILEVSEQKDVYKELKPYLKDKKLTNKEIGQVKLKFARTFTEAGNMQMIVNEYDNAINTFKLSIKLDPAVSNIDAYLSIGDAYLEKNMYDESIKSFKKAIELKSKCADAYKGIIESYIRKGDRSSANKYKEKAKKLNLKI